MKKAMAFAVVGWSALMLAGCGGQSGLLGFAGDDVATAAAVANASTVPVTLVNSNAVDPSGYACWGSLGPGISAIQNGKQVGLATMIEVARVAIIMARLNGPCGALAAPVLGQLSLLPGAGNAIAIAATSVR